VKVTHCHGWTRDTETSVYIGRPSQFGNPFRMWTQDDRADVIAKYEKWFNDRIAEDKDFRKSVLALSGKDLACWCAPRACHGDVILAWLNRQEGK